MLDGVRSAVNHLCRKQLFMKEREFLLFYGYIVGPSKCRWWCLRVEHEAKPTNKWHISRDDEFCFGSNDDIQLPKTP